MINKMLSLKCDVQLHCTRKDLFTTLNLNPFAPMINNYYISIAEIINVNRSIIISLLLSMNNEDINIQIGAKSLLMVLVFL